MAKQLLHTDIEQNLIDSRCKVDMQLQTKNKKTKKGASRKKVTRLSLYEDSLTKSSIESKLKLSSLVTIEYLSAQI